MLSSKGVTDVKREKMREEAKKERAKRAKAANIIFRKEYKVGDVGFVTRKVAPNAEDALSNSLKNGLIDYREILGTKEHHYLGIDNNVPGTPEVNIVNFEDSYKRAQPIEKHSIQNKQPLQRLNGFKKGVEKIEIDSKSMNHKSVTLTENITKSSGNEEKPKLDPQPKAKPPLLTMPHWSKPSPTATEKTPKAHPSKIESILKEMIDTAPPLTDIQTPVKTQDSRFFPHLPPSKDPIISPIVPGKHHSPVKAEELLTNDLITTSDDDTDDEGHHVDHSAVVQRTGGSHLSASSSSSSDGSSSDSSDTDSSDSDVETKNEHSIGKKAIKTPALLNSPTKSNMQISSTPISNTQTPSNHNHNQNIPRTTVDKVPGGKVMKNEMCKKQVSPLNSVPKEVKKDKEIIPEISPVLKKMEIAADKKHTHILNGLRTNDDVHMQPQFSNEYFDSLPFDPLFNEFGPLFDQNTDLEGHNDVTDQHLDTITDIMSLGQMQPPFDNIDVNNSNLNFPNEASQFIQMVDNTVIASQGMDDQTSNHERTCLDSSDKGSFLENDEEDNRLRLPDVVCDTVIDKQEAFDPVTVDMSALSNWNHPINDNSYFPKAPSKPNMKKSEHQRNMKVVKKDASDSLENHRLPNNRKNSASAPLQNKISQSKKNSEHDWFMNILSPGKKYDLPYVNPEKLKFVGVKDTSNQSITSKASKASSLKIQIPFEKIRGGSNQNKMKPQRSPAVKDIITGDKNTSAKKPKNQNSNGVKKVKKKSESKASRAVGKDIETIKRLMAESGKGPSDDDELIDVVGTPSPLKKTLTPQGKVSGKVIRGTPISSSLKKDFTSILMSDKDSKHSDQLRTKAPESNSFKIKQESKHENVRKRTRSNDSFEENSNDCNYAKKSSSCITRPVASKHMKASSCQDDRSVQDMDLDSDADVTQDYTNESLHHEEALQLPVKIDLFRLYRLPGSEACNETKEDKPTVKLEKIPETEAFKEENTILEPVWKSPPNIKIPKIAKRVNEVASKQVKNCTDSQQEHPEQDSGVNNSPSCKQTKEIKEKKTKRPMEGRGVKRKDWERASKNANQNPNVCGMCGTLQKDTGRDPIRLGTYKTSYVEFLSMGKRNKRIADCLVPSERAPKYIDAVLKYIHYLVGLEITGKINTKKGVEEYMCIASQCIDLVDYVINQYGKKENNNISSFDDRFVFLCLRLQSVLYFKLFGVKKDSASRYAKVLSEYFKVRRSPHRGVGMKGSTGTPSPMSPTSSQNGSVASFGSAGSSASSGSYDKMSNGNMVPIPAEIFERMQQYFTYTKYLLHGQRLWDDAESISVKCHEFIGIVSRRIGALTMQSSMLHLVDYISTGLDIIKDNQS